MIELEHSPLGGSGAHRFLECAGSFLLHRDLYESGEFKDVPSEYAERGTGAHELAARCLTEDKEPFEFIGQEFNGFKVGDQPDDINPDVVTVYVNECRSLMPEDGKGKVIIEQTFAHPDIHPFLKGTVDFGFWSSKRGVKLRDYKNGEGIGVSAVNNKQLLYYGYIMVLEYPWLREGPRDFPVDLGIVQPNFYGAFEDADTWQTTLGHVLDWGNEVLLPRMNSLVVTKDISDSDFVPGEHCQFCPVLLECPKMQAAFEEFAKAEEFVAMLTDEELNGYYALRDNARRFMNKLDETVKARLLGGSDIPSAKLVETRTNRVWKSGAEAVLRAALGKHAYEPAKLKSPSRS